MTDIDTAITFTYKVLDVEFPRPGLDRCAIDLTLAGDTYRIEAECDEDDGWNIEATLEDVNQYYEFQENLDLGYGGPGYGHVRGGWVDKDTHLSRTISQDWLEEWISQNVFWPIHEAISKATAAALKKMDGATGTVDWKADE